MSLVYYFFGTECVWATEQLLKLLQKQFAYFFLDTVLLAFV